MSKTQQRKQSAHRTGLQDGIRARPMKFSNKTYLKYYKTGYKKGQQLRTDVSIEGFDDL